MNCSSFFWCWSISTHAGVGLVWTEQYSLISQDCLYYWAWSIKPNKTNHSCSICGPNPNNRNTRDQRWSSIHRITWKSTTMIWSIPNSFKTTWISLDTCRDKHTCTRAKVSCTSHGQENISPLSIHRYSASTVEPLLGAVVWRRLLRLWIHLWLRMRLRTAFLFSVCVWDDFRCSSLDTCSSFKRSAATSSYWTRLEITNSIIRKKEKENRNLWTGFFLLMEQKKILFESVTTHTRLYIYTHKAYNGLVKLRIQIS